MIINSNIWIIRGFLVEDLEFTFLRSFFVQISIRLCLHVLTLTSDRRSVRVATTSHDNRYRTVIRTCPPKTLRKRNARRHRHRIGYSISIKSIAGYRGI